MLFELNFISMFLSLNEFVILTTEVNDLLFCLQFEIMEVITFAKNLGELLVFPHSLPFKYLDFLKVFYSFIWLK